LIDICGFKWQNNGKVGTYKNHALILVNEWTATGQDIKDFANEIQAKVKKMFWIELWPEAIFVE
jgi:UDP-N-acetylmuramate dehydrogenase